MMQNRFNGLKKELENQVLWNRKNRNRKNWIRKRNAGNERNGKYSDCYGCAQGPL